MASKIRENQWNGIFDELISRLGNAFKSIYFLGFFIVGILTLGAMGVWIPYIRFDTIVLFNSESLFTYSGPILGVLMAEFFVEAKKDKLAIIALVIGILALGLISYGYATDANSRNFYTILGTIITLTLFVFVNANDPRFDGEQKHIADALGYDKVSVDFIKDGE